MNNKQKTSISILGCGWLGFSLARSLLKSGFSVKGSTTTQTKISHLRSYGIKPYLLEAPLHLVDPGDLFFNSDILFLNIPFRRNLKCSGDYREQILSVVEAYSKIRPNGWVIFASSTLVYPQLGTVVGEDDVLVPKEERAQILHTLEQDILNGSLDATVIRFGGLYGPARDIGSFIGKTARNLDAKVNLIHLDDAIGIVRAIIVGQARNQVFNAVSDGHPTRRELYTLFKKPIPLGQVEAGEKGKIVSNEKIKLVLKYRFMHSDPQPLRQNIVFCAVLFFSCLIGSVLIFLFAVGMDTGNPIVRNVMRVLVENFVLVLVGSTILNIAVFLVYRLRRRKTL